MNPVAIIDLGTNTFHLLIAVREDNIGFKVMHRERQYVKLAEDGIGRIGPNPFNRAMETLTRFRSIMDGMGVEKYRAVATAALRNASNAGDLIEQALTGPNIEIEVISGKREAELIYKGIRERGILGSHASLIMDIGGGSVECIIGNDRELFWSESFKIGAAVLKHQFHHSEPISPDEMEKLRLALSEITLPLREAIEKFEPGDLVGASGTFDVLADNLANQDPDMEYPVVDVQDFLVFCNDIVQLNLDERLKLDGIPQSRADLIVVAVLLIQFIAGLYDPREIKISNFALKEGALSEMLAKKNT